MNEYVCETDFDAGEIQAAVSDGSLEFWRTDQFGRRWYKRGRMIRGVPKGMKLINADEDDEAGDD